MATLLQGGELQPVFFTLFALRQQGWMGSTVFPGWHTSDSVKHFKNQGFAKRRFYLYCLSTLEEVLPTMDARGVPSSQHDRFYECVLAGFAPPLGKRVAEYEQLLKDHGVEPQAAQADPAVDVPQEWAATDMFGAAEEAEEAAGDVDEGLAEALVADETGEEQNDGGNDYPSVIEGCQLARAEHANYTRLFITCLQTHDARKHHLPCRKYRNIGPNQTAQCGQMEVLAYLLAWARSASRFPNRNLHVKHSPSNGEVLAVAREKWWLSG